MFLEEYFSKCGLGDTGALDKLPMCCVRNADSKTSGIRVPWMWGFKMSPEALGVHSEDHALQNPASEMLLLVSTLASTIRIF